MLQEVLTISRRGATKTRIARKIGLNFQRASAQVDILLSFDYLRKNMLHRRTDYFLTTKGELFLSSLASIRSNLIELNPKS